MKPIRTAPIPVPRVSGSILCVEKDHNHIVHRTLSVITLRTKRSLAGMATEVRPLCLHVYRIGGIWGDDKIIRAEDKKTPRYFLKGTRLAASWQFALHVGGPNGVLVCHVKSPYLGPPLAMTNPGPLRITIGSYRHIVEVHRRRGSPDGTYSFKGLDNKEYRWQPSSGLWGNKMNCLNSQDQIVATYRVTVFAISKDGELRIHQPAQRMADLIVATCLAMRTPDH